MCLRPTLPFLVFTSNISKAVVLVVFVLCEPLWRFTAGLIYCHVLFNVLILFCVLWIRSGVMITSLGKTGRLCSVIMALPDLLYY